MLYSRLILPRAKSVCSMSDFQRLMDSSPFLPDKSRHGDCGRGDVTPPLSPDDLKYIEEFNSKGWSFPVPGPSPTPGHHNPTTMEAWAERPTSGTDAPSVYTLFVFIIAIMLKCEDKDGKCVCSLYIKITSLSCYGEAKKHISTLCVDNKAF